MSHRFGSGMIVAPVLPFTAAGAIDWPTLESYIAQVAAGEPRAIAMNMAASEVSSLEIVEQLEIVNRCKAVIAGGCGLLSGLYVTHTAAARELAPRLVDAGADGIVVFPPVPAFMGTVPVAMVDAYHRAVTERVDVPLLAFQTNFATYAKGAITALAAIPRVVGIKDASFDMDQTVAIIDENVSAPRPVGILTGSDTFLLEAMLMGCDGALIGLAATATAELVRMQSLAQEGRITEAYEIWHKLGPLARIGWRAPFRDYRVRLKYALVRQGVIPNCNVRAPFPGLSNADRADLDHAFDTAGLGDPCFLPAGR